MLPPASSPAASHRARAGASRALGARGASMSGDPSAMTDGRRPRLDEAGYDRLRGRDDWPKLNAHRLHADFTVFDELVNGRPVAFLDPPHEREPRQVLDAMRDFYEHSYANVHHGVYRLAEHRRPGTRRAHRRGLRERPVPARGDLHARRHGGTRSRRYASGLDNLGPGDVVVVAGRPPLELRPLAVRRPAHGCRLQGVPDRRAWRVEARALEGMTPGR